MFRVIRKKDHGKRSTGKLRFDFGGGVEMGVSCYNLVHEASAPSKLKLARDTNETVRSQVGYLRLHLLQVINFEFYLSTI